MARSEDEGVYIPSLREEVDSLFSQVLGVRQAAPIWNPTLDLIEEPDRFVLEMDLPGVRREDLQVELEGSRLTVSGRRAFVRESAGPRFRRRERFSGSFRRSVELPETCDRERIGAVLEEGVLRVEVPKKGCRR